MSLSSQQLVYGGKQILVLHLTKLDYYVPQFKQAMEQIFDDPGEIETGV